MGNMGANGAGVIAARFCPPPWRAILLYAVQGWASAAAVPFAAGQRLPARAVWLPVFIRLLHHGQARQLIADYAMQGMGADRLPSDLHSMVQRAMRRPDAMPGLVDALAGAAGC
jgi:hypothetical protein